MVVASAAKAAAVGATVTMAGAAMGPVGWVLIGVGVVIVLKGAYDWRRAQKLADACNAAMKNYCDCCNLQ